MDQAVVFDNFSAELHGREVVCGVSFSLGYGEVAGLFGKTGCGKTRVALALCGLQPASDGIVRVLDRAIARTSPASGRAVSVGFQSPTFAPELTVQENLEFHAALWRVPWRKRKGRIAFLVQFLGLEGLLKERVGRLSEGEQRVVEIGKALLPETTVVVLDSLLDNISPHLRSKLFRHMFEIARASKTAFLITTACADVAELCDSVILMDSGCVVGTGTPEYLRAAIPDEIVVVQSSDNPVLRKRISERFKVVVREESGELRFSVPQADLAAAEILSGMDSQVACVKVRRPTLHEIAEAMAESTATRRAE